MNGITISIGECCSKTITDQEKAVYLKGKSLISLPNTYTLVDLETTGLSPLYDEIVEVCAIKVVDGSIADRFSSLIYNDLPDPLMDFVNSLTGITRDMLLNAPRIEDVFPAFLDFIGKDIVVGHNINFDLNFICANSSGKFLNDFVDTMRLSRRLHPEEPHHRLIDIAAKYHIDCSGTHRAERDCEITKECFEKISEEIIDKFNSIDDFIESLKKRNSVRASYISAQKDEFDESHPLYGKVCVFTGTLDKMQRKEAMQIVANLGGINADNVTKKTNFLIVGAADYSKIKDGKSNKLKKVEDLQLKGFDIQTMSEDVFYDLIE